MRISDWSSDVCSSDLLELADNADDNVRADLGIEDLDDPFLGHVVERLAELLGLGRIDEGNAAKDFGSEVGKTGDRHVGPLGQRIADAQDRKSTRLNSSH